MRNRIAISAMKKAPAKPARPVAEKTAPSTSAIAPQLAVPSTMRLTRTNL